MFVFLDILDALSKLNLFSDFIIIGIMALIGVFFYNVLNKNFKKILLELSDLKKNKLGKTDINFGPNPGDPPLSSKRTVAKRVKREGNR